MKQRILTFLSIVILLIGLTVLLYPTVSNYIKTQKQRRAINRYVSSMQTISDEDYTELLERAEAFNAKLAENGYLLMNLPDDLLNEYYSILDINGDGIMGYIEVPEADVMLPIYHGTRDAVLQEGAGHVEGSSFPIRGDSVHALISGHRGLPSALLFTNLDRLKTGDLFTVYVLDEAYLYKVQSIETVLPADVNKIHIEKGKNYCTLMTCTPYGINSHRLLIHGELLSEAETEKQLAIQSGVQMVPFYQILIVFEIPVIIIAVILSSRRIRNKEVK